MYFYTLLVQSRNLFYFFIFSGFFLFLCAVNCPSNEEESGKAYKRRSWISVSGSGLRANFGPMFSMWKTRAWKGPVHFVIKCIWVSILLRKKNKLNAPLCSCITVREQLDPAKLAKHQQMESRKSKHRKVSQLLRQYCVCERVKNLPRHLRRSGNEIGMIDLATSRNILPPLSIEICFGPRLCKETTICAKNVGVVSSSSEVMLPGTKRKP